MADSSRWSLLEFGNRAPPPHVLDLALRGRMGGDFFQSAGAV